MNPAPTPRVVSVTPQQRAVIRELVKDGASNVDIATRMGLSEDTVKTHLKNVLKAVGCNNRTALVCLLLHGHIKLAVRVREW